LFQIWQSDEFFSTHSQQRSNGVYFNWRSKHLTIPAVTSNKFVYREEIHVVGEQSKIRCAIQAAPASIFLYIDQVECERLCRAIALQERLRSLGFLSHFGVAARGARNCEPLWLASAQQNSRREPRSFLMAFALLRVHSSTPE